MRLEIDDTSIAFLADERLAGRYCYSDEYKPYLHPLNTPKGHALSLLSPHDHKHHKALMYALRVPEVNFWEERSTLPGEVPGRQRHDAFRTVTESGDHVGFVEELTWLPYEGGETLFREVRSLTCRVLPGDQGYEWTWSTDIQAQRDLDLIMSQWSAPRSDGALVNYHGLGLRLRRDFGCTGGNRLLIDGQERTFAEGMGTVPAEVEFHGSIDGTWPVQRAGVRIRQELPFGLFVLESPFAFLSLGPSNLGPLPMTAGERLVERYVVTAFDLPPT